MPIFYSFCQLEQIKDSIGFIHIPMHTCDCVTIVSKGEVAKVTKLYRRLETDESGAVPLSSVTKLSHFRNNALVKLVARQYARKQDTIGESNSEESVDNSREEYPFDLERFIELFDILSPKKNSSSKLQGIQCTLKVEILVGLIFSVLSNNCIWQYINLVKFEILLYNLQCVLPNWQDFNVVSSKNCRITKF